MNAACPKCGYLLSALARDLENCPRCQTRLSDDGDAGLVVVARLRNAAEAGYFADMLGSNEIETDVFQENEFNAMTGSWESAFLLRVRPDHQDSAVSLLKEDVQLFGDGSDWNEPEQLTLPRAVWRYLAVILVAGGLGYYAGRGSAEVFPRKDQHKTALWRALQESTDPLVGPAGAGNRKLRFDREAGSFLLEEDVDGDGWYDRHRWFIDESHSLKPGNAP